MVNLTKLYTKTGDGGRTHLGDGSQVAKTDRRVEAFGTVDELNSVLGVAMSCPLEAKLLAACLEIQNDLFDLGADLCRPVTDAEQQGEVLRLNPARVRDLETWIDQWNDRLEPLASFILPGGTPAAAHLHHARCVCRRAERGVVALREQGELVSEAVAIYLNRLSDLLFVFARIQNLSAGGDILWKPGGTS